MVESWGGSPLRVLIVDDCCDAADSLHILMGLWGHESRVAYVGTTALALSRNFLPDVILLDLGMPGMSGLQVARLLRQQGETADALILAVTGFGRGEDILRARKPAVTIIFSNRSIRRCSSVSWRAIAG